MTQTAEQVRNSAYRALKPYGKPIGSVSREDLNAAHVRAKRLLDKALDRGLDEENAQAAETSRQTT